MSTERLGPSPPEARICMHSRQPLHNLIWKASDNPTRNEPLMAYRTALVDNELEDTILAVHRTLRLQQGSLDTVSTTNPKHLACF